MGKFTQTQADNCVTIRDHRNKSDGSHVNYSFMVCDQDGNKYKWTDTALSATATKAVKKTAIIDYLKTIEKLPAPVVETIEEDKHSLVGKKIKDA